MGLTRYEQEGFPKKPEIRKCQAPGDLKVPADFQDARSAVLGTAWRSVGRTAPQAALRLIYP